MINLAGGFLKELRRLFIPVMGSAALLLLTGISAAAAEKAEKIAVFPTVPYDGYIIYQSLAIFWLFIIGLLVILRMKLREIERTQALGLDEEDTNAPLLE
jgi:hypothetical protein